MIRVTIEIDPSAAPAADELPEAQAAMLLACAVRDLLYQGAAERLSPEARERLRRDLRAAAGVMLARPDDFTAGFIRDALNALEG